MEAIDERSAEQDELRDILDCGSCAGPDYCEHRL